MNGTKKLKLTYFTIGFYFLLGGVEYAVILPTLWLYLSNRFDAPQYMLGLVLTAFPLSGLFAGPLMGRWSDRTQNTKLVLLVSNLFEIVGSVMYFLGNNFSVWFLVGSRLVAGIGTGAGSAVFADIARVTTVEERTGVMSVFMAVRQLGLLAGPGCNLFLRKLDFHIGSFPVDKYTAPGLFMALLWIIMEILTLFIYWNLPQLKKEIDEKSAATDIVTGNGPRSDDAIIERNTGDGVEIERDNFNEDANSAQSSTAVTHRHYGSTDRGTAEDTEVLKTTEVSYPWRYYYDEFVRDEVIAILATVFVAFFNQTALEALVTPLTALLLDWEELENSIMYCLAGVELLLMFLLLRLVLTKYLSDRSLLLLGMAMETAALAFNLWFVPQAPPHSRNKNIAGLIVGLVLDLAGLPIIVVCAASLYSKITRPETQGLSQGIRRVAGSLGTIIGPLWPSGLMHNMYAMFGVMVAVNLFGMALLVASFPRLQESKPSVITRTGGEEEEKEEEETAPLLTGQQHSINA